MEFQTITGASQYKKATDLAVGEKLVAYLLGANESRNYPGKFDLRMRDLDGSDFILSTAGSLKYFALDLNAGKNPHVQALNHLCEIVRTEDTTNKRKQVVSNFRVGVGKQTVDEAPAPAPRVDGTEEIPF